jgi:hypothetical protein
VLTSQEVIEAAGITYRQLDWWTRCGYVQPPDPEPGSGTPRQWPDDEAVVVVIMAALVLAGVQPRQAAHAARSAILDTETGAVSVPLPGGFRLVGTVRLS